MFDKLKNKLAMAAVIAVSMVSSAGAVIDFSALTDLINATFTVLDTIVANGSTLIEVIVLFGTLGLIGIIIYGFIGKLLTKIGNMGMGGRPR